MHLSVKFKHPMIQITLTALYMSCLPAKAIDDGRVVLDRTNACVRSLTNKARAAFARDLAKKLDLMIVVHPHAVFDASHAIVPMVTRVVDQMPSEKVVILQGFYRDEDTGS